MIEKSRLEELIKQGATIYYKDKDIGLIFLNEYFDIDEIWLSGTDRFEYWLYCNNVPYKSLECLYETQKQAEWALKYQRIPHTEYLSLPTWEEIQQNIRSFPKELKTQANKNIVRFSSPRGYFSLIVYRCYGTRNKYLDLSQCQETLKAWKATEENYIKACDLCVKLFKGESDESVCDKK